MDKDFSNPFSFTPNFTDLLNSQQEVNTPPTLPLTQTKNNNRWSVPEEKVLVSVWLNTSKDAIVGNEQKGGAFWERVVDYYNSSSVVANLPKREANTCKQKWCKMMQFVSKFAGCYELAMRQKRSGQNEDDAMELAYQVYFQDHGKKFTLEHVWRLLRHDQKWCELRTEKSTSNSKRTKVNEANNFSSVSNTACEVDVEPEERPPGVKASKAKGKKRVRGNTEETEGSSLKMLDDLWVKKEKDMAARNCIIKQRMLDNLIGKTEPLTEGEIILKEKLITYMCNLL